MANKIEYSRLTLKRSTVTGVVPTVPTGTTIDNTWLSTDILVGELFANVEDDRLWIRTNAGLTEIEFSGAGIYLPLSGGSMTGALSADTLYIYDVGSGTSIYNLGIDANGQVVTGSTVASGVSAIGDGLNTYTGETAGVTTVNVSGGTFDNLTVTGSTTLGDVTLDELSATTLSILNSGATSHSYSDYSGNLISSAVTNSAIVGGSGNTINTGLANVIVAGVDITADTSDTMYVSNLNIGTIGAGSPTINLGLDSSGNVVTGTTGSGPTNYLPLTGGTMTGNISLDSGVRITGTGNTMIQMDGTAHTSNVVISTDNGNKVYSHLSIEGTKIEMFGRSPAGADIEILADDTVNIGRFNTSTAQYDEYINIADGGIKLYTALGQTGAHFDENDTFIGRNAVGVGGGGELQVRSNTSAIPTTGPALTHNAVFIGAQNSKMQSGVTNSVIMGCNGITGDTSNTTYVENLNIKGNLIGAPYDTSVSISDETTAITTGTSKITFYAPRDFTITKVKVSLSTSGSTTTTIDVNINGTTLLSSPIDLSSGVYVNSTTSIATSSVTEDDKITVDIDAAGTAAAGAKVYLIGKTS